MRTFGVLAIASAILLCTAVPATAATTASFDGTTLTVTSAVGEANKASVLAGAPAGVTQCCSGWKIIDDLAGTAAGPGCLQEPLPPDAYPGTRPRLFCAGGPATVQIDVGDGDDGLDADSGPFWRGSRISANLGPGNDDGGFGGGFGEHKFATIDAGPGNDSVFIQKTNAKRVLLGPGDDVFMAGLGGAGLLKGGPGNDQLCCALIENGGPGRDFCRPANHRISCELRRKRG